MGKIIDWLSDLFDRFSRFTIVLLFAIAFVSVLYQVFSRYVLQGTYVSDAFPSIDFSVFTFPWMEEFIRYLFVWIVFLGIGVVYKRKGHAQVELLTAFLAKRWRRRVGIIVEMINAGFFLLLLVKGYSMLKLTNGQLSPSLQINMVWMYLSILVCSIICLAHSVASLMKEVRAQSNPDVEQSEPQSTELAEIEEPIKTKLSI
ncbi:TRAP transporter small permease [Brevibacillus humidisoli]|uniref:TRAP transporter small permease n=1 Tax=Brevibacillus humidisoli TaxID=2895522 RepID=UPI001E64EF4A|nr:TRAP transporter small permease [Brevibacillus humidisoli]UFJ38922.1 TRAP transporter small permease [Brevibacillus humidisoli]